jgi:hypothetical protein
MKEVQTTMSGRRERDCFEWKEGRDSYEWLDGRGSYESSEGRDSSGWLEERQV